MVAAPFLQPARDGAVGEFEGPFLLNQIEEAVELAQADSIQPGTP